MKKKMRLKVIFILILLSFNCFSQSTVQNFEDKENEFIEFDSIKGVLENDRLEKYVEKKQKKIIKRKIQKKNKEIRKHFFPQEKDFWTFFSEYWLVKNIQKVNWDFDRADYGLAKAFESILKDLGYLNKKFKILLLNTTRIFHLSLPANKNESILLISLPFIQSMDLTKREICLILLEDFLRNEKKMFLNKIDYTKLKNTFGQNMYGKAIDKNLLNDMLSKYSNFIFNSGFTFQDQYELTKSIYEIIRYNKKMKTSYVNMLTKKDRLIKEFKKYEKYNDFYPSPEMQLKWIEKL